MKKILLSIIISSVSLSALAEVIFNIQIPQPDFVSNDWDGDNIPNIDDPDDDNDGIYDVNDSTPFGNVSESVTQNDNDGTDDSTSFGNVSESVTKTEECIFDETSSHYIINKVSAKYMTKFLWEGNSVIIQYPGSILHSSVDPFLYNGYEYWAGPKRTWGTWPKYEICRKEV